MPLSSNRVSLTLAALVLAALTAACGGNVAAPTTTGTGGGTGSTTTGGTGGDGSTGGGGASPTLDAACAHRASVLCAQYTQCSAFLLDILFGDQATCEARTKARCVADFSLPDVNATPADIEACEAAVEGQSCDAFFSGAAPICQFPGARDDGAPCVSSLQCKHACDVNAGAGGCGKCVTPPPAGADCDPSKLSLYQCSPGDFCAAATGKCTANLPEGSACAESDTCEGILTCVNGKCSKAAGLGEPCPSGFECDFFQGLGCDFGSPAACAPYTIAKAGDDCLSGLSICDAASSCEVSAGVCVAYAKDGDPCPAASECLPLSTCIAGACTLAPPMCP